jgi:hypothetical protein
MAAFEAEGFDIRAKSLGHPKLSAVAAGPFDSSVA